MSPDPQILWRRDDRSGHEFARITRRQTSWVVSGVALFEYERQPCRLDYEIVCDSAWATISAQVTGWVGRTRIDCAVAADRGEWLLDGRPVAAVRGSVDVDLNFSPSTNLLPIRRLHLAIGESATVVAAWLRFPTFTLEPLEQIYRRLGESTYRYESAGGSFVAELEVESAGLPIRYANIWSAVATS